LQKAEIAYGEQLLSATLQSQEEERKRIGRDLHDDVGASLSNLKMIMSQTNIPAEGKEEYKPLIDRIITTVRSISHSLSPPGLDLFGLEHTLHEFFDSFNVPGSLQLEFTNETGNKLDALDKQTALALYRIIQELTNNTIRHADATAIRIKCYEEKDAFVMTYQDNGKGMEWNSKKKTGMGMQNIEARLKMLQATYTVNAEPGAGFFIKIKFSNNK